MPKRIPKRGINAEKDPDPYDLMLYIVDNMRKLAMNDPGTDSDTKRKIFMLYLEYLRLHRQVEEDRNKMPGALQRLIDLFRSE